MLSTFADIFARITCIRPSLPCVHKTYVYSDTRWFCRVRDYKAKPLRKDNSTKTYNKRYSQNEMITRFDVGKHWVAAIVKLTVGVNQ